LIIATTRFNKCGIPTRIAVPHRVGRRVDVAVQFQRILVVDLPRIPAQEAPGGWVVLSSTEIVQASQVIVALAGVQVGVAGCTALSQQFAISCVAVGVADVAQAVGQQAGAVLRVGQIVVGCAAAAV
jgi:hypothetical protein